MAQLANSLCQEAKQRLEAAVVAELKTSAAACLAGLQLPPPAKKQRLKKPISVRNSIGRPVLRPALRPLPQRVPRADCKAHLKAYAHCSTRALREGSSVKRWMARKVTIYPAAARCRGKSAHRDAISGRGGKCAAWCTVARSVRRQWKPTRLRLPV